MLAFRLKPVVYFMAVRSLIGDAQKITRNLVKLLLWWEVAQFAPVATACSPVWAFHRCVRSVSRAFWTQLAPAGTSAMKTGPGFRPGRTANVSTGRLNQQQPGVPS